jgi:transketolase
MKLNQAKEQELKELCRTLRIDALRAIYQRGSGHAGGSLSVCEIMAALYFEELHVRPSDPDWPERDRVVLCKGHAAPMLYAALSRRGFFPPEEMSTLRHLDSRLQGHPCAGKTPGVDATTGPLGLGLSFALGLALSLRLNGSAARVYAILGDGELNEGTVWEACMAAAKYRAENLCAILDWNGVQLDGTTEEIMPMGDTEAKFRSFGWHTILCDGHDIAALTEALAEARTVRGQPTILLARTIKGKGVSFMEGQNTWHGKVIDSDSFAAAMAELGGVV